MTAGRVELGDLVDDSMEGGKPGIQFRVELFVGDGGTTRGVRGELLEEVGTIRASFQRHLECVKYEMDGAE
jgi:hypothetical protein